MTRGGARVGAGRKKGVANRPKLQLQVADESAERKPTPAERMRALKRKVALCVAADMAPNKIAAVLGMPVDKLRAVFVHELEHGREIIRAEELFRLDAASAEGKVSASKIILTRADAPTVGAAKKPEVSSRHSNIVAGALRLLDGGKTK